MTILVLPVEGFTSFKTDTGGAETLVPGEQYEIRHGMNMPVYVQLTGSTGASLSILNQSVS